MSNTESFIEEVSEEVRRDKLYQLMRKWGWVPVLAIVLIVGGAIWSEWSKAREAAKNQAFGDAVMDALAGEDMAARRAALAEVQAVDSGQQVVLSLLRATAALNGEESDAEAAKAELLALADNPEVEGQYRHLALLKVMLAGGTDDVAQNALFLEELAAPGAPFRAMAVELQAYAALEAGDEATAITLLRLLTEEAEATQALRRRAQQLIVALGASPDPA
ncbi:hypothetical protein [Jannaschia pohangensis]|uniref:Tetratricopeptide repeat-like domain-containing protein n=1 Tax=Jannaschia pohangensis TaxID=390807 RepID=A0A1I3I9L6_9RHOB|nr:hypothetical protein [Jannaschia pohangensis]SFI44678.1 hypothetical protein SAMN04488095_0872 [Jannaschia pohangensis]